MRRGSYLETFPATAVLLLTVIGFFAIEVIYDSKVHDRDLARSAMEVSRDIAVSLGANSPRHLLDGQVWRLIAHAFLHASLLHIFLNGVSLADLGRLCEPLLGTERFTVAYLGSAIGGGLASAAWSHFVRGGGLSVGASGAIFGLVGLLFGFSVRHRDRELREQIWRMVLYPVLITFLFPQIDHAAHAGGFVTGAVFGFITPRYVSSQSARRWRLPFWVAAAAAAAALGLAIWNRYTTPLLPLGR